MRNFAMWNQLQGLKLILSMRVYGKDKMQIIERNIQHIFILYIIYD